ncbi:TRAP transporter large permease [Candidatus Caldatribacterium sp.]|uniref:TRAP transporter large permease n=1 Tax=Candidatus Caldatribacterium sp. TaxID=2282143 RepID=UPI002999805F|nr:TRAP transporter large permease [Candidatus Caldatribacterium sp.]MDW8080650.1 TRAP transporter large permease [Candidatus Calescibacterium sp.]
MELAIFVGLLIFLFLTGLPVAFALGIAGLVSMLIMWGTAVPLGAVAQRVLYGVNSFVLLAIPLFLLTGKLMNAGGITQRIFKFARCLVGHWSGGLGQVNILASMIFAGMSGLATADTAGLGVVELKAMREAGYDDEFSCAITGASATVGPIIPPSVPLVVYGILASASIGRLLIGGIIPGILVGIALMVMTAFYGRKYPRDPKPSKSELLKAFKEALAPGLTPFILILGMLSGIFTATEAAAIAATYAFVLSFFVYRELSLRELWKILKETAIETATITFIIACAAFYGWVLIRGRAPIILAETITGLSSNPLVVLLLLNLFLLVVGCFMETIAAISILVPVLVPLISRVGIDPIHFGLVMVLNLMIGLLTPPFGMSLFILSRVSGLSPLRIARASLPFLIPILVVLALITIFPSLVTFLPNLAFGVK